NSVRGLFCRQKVDAQWAPLGGTPETTAMTGGLLRVATSALATQSQAKNAIRVSQSRAVRNGLYMARPAHKPKCRRTRRPIIEPMNAMTTQIQPCRLPVDMPLTMAPMLQPNASREL